MKKIKNKNLASALLRGAVAVSGTMCTTVAMLFTDSWSGFFGIALLGGITVTLLTNSINN